MTASDPISELFAAHPDARRRIIRACVLAVRSSGRSMEDVRPLSLVLRGRALMMVGADGTEIVRLPVESLTRRLDA